MSNLVKIILKSDTVVLNRKRFTVKKDTTVGQVQFKIRKCIDNLMPCEALFCFFNDDLQPASKTMREIQKGGTQPVIVMVDIESAFGALF